MDFTTLKKITLNDSLEKIVLFGLFNQIERRVLISRVFANGVEVCVFRVESLRANVFLDILYINDAPVGSIFSVLIAKNLVHVAGFYICEDFRGYKLSSLDNPEYTTLPVAEWKGGSAAKYLLSVFVRLMVCSRIDICLEVKNYNEPACKLYGGFSMKLEGGAYKFEIAAEQQINIYARIRGKKIGDIYDFVVSKDVLNENIKVVRWKAVPLYNNTHIWSINRLYIMKAVKGDDTFDATFFQCVVRRIKFAIRVVVYGDLIGYIKLKFLMHKCKEDVS